MIKNALKLLVRTIISGIIAFVILTLFCQFYFNLPVRVTNKAGSTDDKWEANKFYSLGYEGFTWGKTNNEGFANTFDYDNDMTIDILAMGSSHMQGFGVNMDQSAASKLNALFRNKTVYNISFSAHFFLTCASNLKAALNEYMPTEYVVIETSSILFSDDDITLVINEETPEIVTYDEGIIGLLQKNPYLRLLYMQIETYANTRANSIDDAEDVKAFTESDTANNEKLLHDLFQKMGALAEEHGVKLIIMYHPHLSIAPNGTIEANDNESAIARFQRACSDNGILFLDMSDRFKEEYESSYILPHGFVNSPVGTGHLNQYGHAMIADELYHLILEDER